LDKQNKNRPCLVEFSFGIALEGVLIAQGPISLEKLQLSMNNTKTILRGGLYDFIRDAKAESHTKVPQTQTIAKASHQYSEDNFQRIAPIVPKVYNSY